MVIFDAHRHLNTLRRADVDELEARAYVRVLGKVLQEQEELREREEERRLAMRPRMPGGGAVAVVETQKHVGELCEAGVVEAHARAYLRVLREMLQEREEERMRLVEEHLATKKAHASDNQRETTTNPNAT